MTGLAARGIVPPLMVTTLPGPDRDACRRFDRRIGARDALTTGAVELDAHLRACAECRELAALVAPVADDASAELPLVDARHYEKQALLGEGGMGRTFIAWDRRLERTVVLKEPRAGDATAARRLAREARVTARLAHPAIVGIHEAGRYAGGPDDGLPFYAMPLVRGVALAVEIARRPQLAERVRLVPAISAVAHAVAYAHDRGVVHRDLKPDNIIIGEFGEAVVIDWGLAAPLDDDGDPADGGADRTAPGVGTPAYMPPEQAIAAPRDARADVYALGATLYHVLAGAPPYGDPSPLAPRARVLAGPPRSLDELAPDAPAPLRAIVAVAMARRPDDRFADARALADELARFGAGLPVRSYRHTARERLALWLRRHRGVARVAIIGAIGLAAVGAAAVAGVVAQRRVALEERATAIAARADAQEALARNLEDQGLRELADDHPDRAAVLLAEANVRHPQVRTVELALGEARRRLARRPLMLGGAEPIWGLAFDRTGRTVVSGARGGDVRAWDVATGQPRATIHVDGDVESVAIPAGGSRAMVARSDGTLEILDLEGPRRAVRTGRTPRPRSRSRSAPTGRSRRSAMSTAPPR